MRKIKEGDLIKLKKGYTKADVVKRASRNNSLYISFKMEDYCNIKKLDSTYFYYVYDKNKTFKLQGCFLNHYEVNPLQFLKDTPIYQDLINCDLEEK